MSVSNVFKLFKLRTREVIPNQEKQKLATKQKLFYNFSSPSNPTRFKNSNY